MNLKALQSTIANVHVVAQQNVVAAINQSLTLRNWLIGYYIVEYKQNRSDRQKYGAKILQLIAEHASKKNIKGLSQTSLKLCRQFFIQYPSIGQLATDQFKNIKYELGDLNNKIFITKYKIALPSERVLKNFIKKDILQFYSLLKTNN